MYSDDSDNRRDESKALINRAKRPVRGTVNADSSSTSQRTVARRDIGREVRRDRTESREAAQYRRSISEESREEKVSVQTSGTAKERIVRTEASPEGRRRSTGSEKGSTGGRRRAGSKRRRRARRIRKIKRILTNGRFMLFCAAVLLVLILLVVGISKLAGHGGGIAKVLARQERNLFDPDVPLEEQTGNSKALLAAARQKANMYDYDAALEILKSYSKDYTTSEELTNAVQEYETTKASLVEYPVEEVTHVFFHMLLYEPEVSFGETCDNPDGMNIYMTTVSEFKKIIQQMYDKGYVLVSIYDVASPDENGTFQPGKIMLPPGKKAFVLSEDDVCCYHSYENAGIADKFIIDEKTGKVKTHYTHLDGTEEVGDFDVLPILDTFIEEHPDFSYKGAKGILALTGYNGILGYRTDTTYNEETDRDRHEQAWLDAHPDFNYEQECEEAKKVAQAIRDDGWLFASHSWGHMWQDRIGDSDFAEDAAKWMERVNTLIGGTDIWIYPNGQDVDCDMYAARFDCLQNYGFKYFCPVNSLQYSVRVDSYGLNMGRRNLDGYRMYYDMIDDEDDKLSDLFDVNSVFDPARPTPVPEI